VNKIKAKSISDGYWILHNDKIKIGDLKENAQGYSVKINGEPSRIYPSMKKLKATHKIEFMNFSKTDVEPKMEVYGYPTGKLAYNEVWNAQYKLPLFTYSVDSKSWYAAGYYSLDDGTVEFCPKLITLQRTTFNGPLAEKPEMLFDKLIDLS